MEKKEEFIALVKRMLELIGENPNREGLKKTPLRVYKAFEYLTSGYKKNPEEILTSALFKTKNDEMVVVKNIEFYSLCEHHLLPIIGKVHVAYIPNGVITGLSKIPRVVEVFARRLQIQEEFTEEIAETIDRVLKPKGVGVVVEASHMCMEMRGVEKVCSITTTSSLRGLIRKDPRTRAEFFNLIKSNDRSI